MKKSKKWIIGIIVLLVIVGIGWLSFGHKSESQNEKVVKVGLMSGSKADDEIWNSVAKTAKDKYHIKLQFVHFTDYTQPNAALTQHSVDINAFQHYAFLNDWNKKHHTDIKSIGNTVISPIRLYSNKYKNVKQIPNGSQIVIPNDATNESRSLIVLKDAGLLKLKDTKNGLLTVGDIKDNPKKLDIKEVDASQTPRLLNDSAAAVVNTNYALTAHLSSKKSIFVEPTNKQSKPWINLIATNKDDENKKEYKDVVKAYQTNKTADLIKKNYGDLELPAWNRKFN
ncbi:ABC transporter substrate-binding protein [Fructilactobacillus lindneri]|uniref:Lipoprotein n=2 Tax=Fructilactobacillus lindneri TaxID=53444 RepID=A0A0R2JTU5_9LACO|nr:MetQ/NlpA family ABC transporter substrate-binding protein [Fructilactobacillus lindneri]ANZ57524.1 ABC transporter substrate-binding protein [Fructilactobacillus lindneri]ANZ58792.1 ABC transporter substrate-binding protein [Fructilactobacillus lindneri]KRN80513.1 Outer membrane lipoprotein [Fructilactobacillus lindneri DSM 20690 = JCM 11027]POG97780.1 ABC transporter substrate-binding protein [Fructilactobacillus lindneri]POG99112.1 ABC transporter substrate-binding protein [Fructilactoba